MVRKVNFFTFISKICSEIYILIFIDLAIGDDTSFDSLKECVSEKTLKAISDMGFTNMTEIQHKSIRPLLNGR